MKIVAWLSPTAAVLAAWHLALSQVSGWPVFLIAACCLALLVGAVTAPPMGRAHHPEPPKHAPKGAAPVPPKPHKEK